MPIEYFLTQLSVRPRMLLLKRLNGGQRADRFSQGLLASSNGSENAMSFKQWPQSRYRWTTGSSATLYGVIQEFGERSSKPEWVSALDNSAPALPGSW